MKKNNSAILILVAILFSVLPTMAQDIEPDFIGEVYLLKSDGSHTQLGKEMANFTSGISWSSNSFDALSIELNGGRAQTRLPSGNSLQLVVRAVDNNSDPLAIISIYKFKSKKKKRSLVISENNSGTLMKSRTHTKDMVNFNGRKYGTSSYLIDLKNLEVGEYGIIVSNPNARDQKRSVVSCFAIDN